ncbi:MAG TPA: glycosyltransferase [Vicinamibacteria bacterium]|jgi:hypothetical protein
MERLSRALGRNRILGPALELVQRRRLLASLGGELGPTAAPADLMDALPGPIVAHHDCFRMDDVTALDTVVLRVDRLVEVDARVLRHAREALACVFLSGRYAAFRRGGAKAAGGDPARRLLMRMQALEAPETRGWAHHRPAPPASRPGSASPRRAALVTTFDRPGALRRSLPQIGALGLPVLVVDDGSAAWAREANRALCREWDAAHLALPENRGLPAALNAGLAYWLADPAIEWVSYFQDDVDVSPALLDVLGRIEDVEKHPLLTGYDAPEHPDVEVVDLQGVRVKLKRSTPAVHLHGHASYWSGVMPIPSPYLGAPKPRVGASMEDWWIVSHAPRSAEQRGLLVPCVPGLVSTFLWHRDDSSWDNG